MIIFSLTVFFVSLVAFIINTALSLANGVRIMTGNIGEKFVKISKSVLFSSLLLMVISLILFMISMAY